MSEFPMIHQYFTQDGRRINIDEAGVDDLRECVKYLFAELESARKMHRGALEMMDTIIQTRRRA